MYFVYNRNTLQLEGEFPVLKADHTEPPFIALPAKNQDVFRREMDLLNMSTLEVKLMYRNTGDIKGRISFYRDNLLSELYYLLTRGNPVTRHTATLFNEDAEPVQAGTGPRNTCAAASTLAKAAPRGGNRLTIFEVADKMWADAGSPKDVPSVLAIRKAVMSELEANHGIKKTTSSTALGDWQKARLNG